MRFGVISIDYKEERNANWELVEVSRSVVPVDGEIFKIEGFERFCFFLHKPIGEVLPPKLGGYCFVISEAMSGAGIAHSSTILKTKAQAVKNLAECGKEKFQELINQAIAKTGKVANIKKEIKDIFDNIQDLIYLPNI